MSLAAAAVALARRRPAAVAACGGCRYFRSSAMELEAQLPGLRTMSSAFAAVRSADGLCARHDRYLSASYSCADFQAAHRHGDARD